jgi:hypothetical protein
MTNILFSPYNWYVTNSSAETINSGAYFRTLVGGSKTCGIGLIIGTATPYSQCWARFDSGNWQEYVPTTSGAQTWSLTLPNGTTTNKHLLEFVIKSTTETQDRWNNQTTSLTFTGITLDAGGALTLPTARRYCVLIYGDSITEGVRVNGFEGIPNDTDRNDVLSDYSYNLGPLLDAEIGVVGFGATGLSRGGSGNVPPLPQSYNQLWKGQPRDFSPVPDLVIYNEGTNDGNDSTTPQMVEVIKGIGYRGKANTHAGLNGTRHLVLEPFAGSQKENLQAAVKSIGSSNVVYGSTEGFWSRSDASDGLHPYGYAHLNSLAPLVSTLALPLLRP